MKTRTFDLLTPHVVVSAVESAFDLTLDGTLTPYPSYVNRVYGLRTDDGIEYVAKFYRPGRWEYEAIMDEHEFILECRDAELPVVSPIEDTDGDTLAVVTASDDEKSEEFDFALFPKKGGRNFDADRDEDWLRIGSHLGRLHSVAERKTAPNRLVCTPDQSTQGFVNEIMASNVVHPGCSDAFFPLIQQALDLMRPLFEGRALMRIHGDFHRGNILDRPGEGLMTIDFDDMMNGPAVHDLWLLLPGRKDESREELNLILEGYERFHEFDYFTLQLIEPLRMMRMIYYLAWQTRQRDDKRFREVQPEWGTEAFWIKEIEDIRTQYQIIAEECAS